SNCNGGHHRQHVLCSRSLPSGLRRPSSGRVLYRDQRPSQGCEPPQAVPQSLQAEVVSVMGTVYCDNCGTSLLEENAKFCRACGKPPLSEAATKRFDEPPSVQVPTSPVGPSLTTPAYMAPFEF